MNRLRGGPRRLFSSRPPWWKRWLTESLSWVALLLLFWAAIYFVGRLQRSAEMRYQKPDVEWSTKEAK